MSRLLQDLQAMLARFDDAAFEALANKGLLRRAQKDLEKLPPHLIEEQDGGVQGKLVVAVGEQRVSFDARGPAQATCTCPASGVCQHILSGSLWIRALPLSAADESPGIPSQNLHDDLMAFSHAQIEKWSGKANFRWAAQFLRDIDSPEAASLGGVGNVTVSFERPRFSCVFVDKNLDSAVLHSVSGDTRKYAAAALLAFQLAHGRSLPAPELRAASTGALDLGQEHRLAEAASASRPRLRAQVLGATERLAAECVSIGLSHLSQAIAERFTTLAVAAQGADLYRLALLLRRIADHAEMLIRRDGGARESELLDDLALANALVAALRAAGIEQGVEGPRHLVGQARTTYESVGNLELTGMGAYPWRTKSGYLGLTVLLHAQDRDEWFTWSEARPEIQGGFNPVARYGASGPWPGCSSPANLNGKRLTLMNAQANRHGRLSAAEGTTGLVHDLLTGAGLMANAVSDWRALLERCAPQRGTLQESDPRSGFCVLRPTNFHLPRFDTVSQTLDWPLEDEHGALLVVRVPYTSLNAHAISRIEAMKDCESALLGLVADVTLEAGALLARPVSLVTSDPLRPIDAVALDAPPAKQSRFAKFLGELGKLMQGNSSAGAALTAAQAPGAALVDGSLAEALRLAERGCMGNAATELEMALAKCDAAGLSIPMTIWKGHARQERQSGSQLLRTAYVLRELRKRL